MSQSRVALVVGATGLVGSALVLRLLLQPLWQQVVTLTRRPLEAPPTDPRLQARVVDFATLGADAGPAACTHLFCALGTTRRAAGSAAAFRAVDLDLVLTVARAGLAQGARHFLLVSAAGASVSSPVLYSRVKGEVEAAVAALGYGSVTIVRPSFLVGDRRESRPLERLGTQLGRWLPPRWRSVRASAVAAALADAAREDRPGVQVLENPVLLNADEDRERRSPRRA